MSKHNGHHKKCPSEKKMIKVVSSGKLNGKLSALMDHADHCDECDPVFTRIIKQHGPAAQQREWQERQAAFNG